MTNEVKTFSLSPTSLKEAMDLADLISKSEMVPKDYQGKSANVLIAVQMGAEVGLPPMQALQNIAVINGRPSLWGDAIKAIILDSNLCEKFEESFDDQSMTAKVLVKRINHKERVVTFSKADAELAKLWGKAGPWTQYPKRMLQMRARAFAARDEFADVLKGLSSADEQRDVLAVKDITPDAEAESPALIEHYPQDQFESNFPVWEKQVFESGKEPEKIIRFLQGKGANLSDDQIKKIESIGVAE